MKNSENIKPEVGQIWQMTSSRVIIKAINQTDNMVLYKSLKDNDNFYLDAGC